MPTRAPRADSVRNREALLVVGERLFAEQGPNLAFEDVAREAGVGKGTLYRHFATRDHLLVALLQGRFDGLRTRADELLEADDPFAAVAEWLREFDRYPLRSRRLGSRVGEGLVDGSSEIATACQPMKAAFTRLLVRAQSAGTLRADVDATELLTVVAALPEQFKGPDGSSRFLDVIIQGLTPRP